MNSINKLKTLGDITKATLMRHLNAFIEQDMEALMSDYTEESVMMTQQGTYTGLAEIEGFFSELMVYFPKMQFTFELDQTVVREELLLIVWHAKAPRLVVPFATDTFVMKEGKIYRQTFAGVLNFVN